MGFKKKFLKMPMPNEHVLKDFIVEVSFMWSLWMIFLE
jgi:hypothetical protein